MAVTTQQHAGETNKNAHAVEVYLVIGQKNSGKSTVISALTGVRQIQIRWKILYQINADPVETFIHPRSLQEYPKTPIKFIKEVAASGVTKVFVALREYGIGQSLRYPNAQTYVDEFERAGWVIKAQAQLAGARPVVTKHPSLTSTVCGRPWIATNATAAIIRKAWNLP
jgi:energy-coupling factor transporter ATP-binding protein EcfA2